MAFLPHPNTFLAAAKCYAKNYINLTGSVRHLMSKQLVYSEFGDPLSVLKVRETEVPCLGSQDVLVRMLAAPINPADINTIQGKYPVKVMLPCIPGNEGVGVVEEIGKEVCGVRPGNKVIVTKPVQGTWRDIATFNNTMLKVVPDNLGLAEAATLTVNPCTAFRMLTDFKPVRNGSMVVIQNGANSACGQNVIQICKAWGVKNINIVRNRPEINELKSHLQSLGATYVLTEEELRSTTIFREKQIDKPSLALNCVGGKSSLEMLRHLGTAGCMVTYGGMSREPVTIPTSAFIFKNLAFYGFWMTAWNEKASNSAKDEMMSEVISLMCEKKLRAPVHKMVKFVNFKEAIGNTLTSKGFQGYKYILDFRRNICLPNLPAVPGDEGVGDVVEIGKHVCRVAVGDRIVLSTRLLGSWRGYGIYNERDVHVIAKNLTLPEAAMLTIAPCSAYRMLNDFRKMKPGDTVIQNAANSPCGQSVIQLCKARGINTFNIVADHCDYGSVKSYLLQIGATEVHTLEEAEALTAFDTSLARPTLALNCLGGRYEDVLLKLLKSNGAIVYHGCAYYLPFMKKYLRCDAEFYKFHIHNWEATATCLEKDVMYKKIIQQMIVGDFRAPVYIPIELREYVVGVKNTGQYEAFSTLNYVFDFTLPCC